MKNYYFETEGTSNHIVKNFDEVEAVLESLDCDDHSFAILSTTSENYIQCAKIEHAGYDVEVRTKSSKETRHYRRDTSDLNELVAYFLAYMNGEIFWNDWEDVTDEYVREPIVFAVPDNHAGNHKAFVHEQLMKIVAILTENDDEILHKMEENFAEIVRPELLDAKRNVVKGELLAASWLPHNEHLDVDTLVWTRVQWERMLAFLRTQGMIRSVYSSDTENIRVFERMLDSLLKRKQARVDYHTPIFHLRRNQNFLGWCCAAEDALNQAGFSLPMLGKFGDHYPFALIDATHARTLWDLSFSIGMRAANMTQYGYFSNGSLIVTSDADERIKLWRATGLLQMNET